VLTLLLYQFIPGLKKDVNAAKATNEAIVAKDFMAMRVETMNVGAS
jgi:hypothetical protein